MFTTPLDYKRRDKIYQPILLGESLSPYMGKIYQPILLGESLSPYMGNPFRLPVMPTGGC